ncbi:MAG: hypothetical protein GF331_00285 [Chitinivibrionales bacterium]|nr:hypothetical protein [Chitinivibrionales bacterium]
MNAQHGLGGPRDFARMLVPGALALLLVSSCAYQYSSYSRCTTATVCSGLDSIPGSVVVRVGGGGGRTREAYFAPGKIPGPLVSGYSRSYRAGKRPSASARDRHVRDSLRDAGVRFLNAQYTTFGSRIDTAELRILDTSLAAIDTVFMDSCCAMKGVCVALRVKRPGTAKLQTRRSTRRGVVRIAVEGDSVRAEECCRRRERHSRSFFWFLF